MKTYATAWTNALAAGQARSVGAAKIEATDPFRAWGGFGTITVAGESYVGVGDAGLVSVTGAQIGGSEDAIHLALSNVEPDTAALVDAAGARNARVITWRLGFDLAGENLLDAQIFDQGRLDQLSVDENPTAPGQPAKSTVTALVETAIRGLGKMTGRRTADADQRAIAANDASCSMVTQAGQLTLAWGGKPPSRAIEGLPGARAVDFGGAGGVPRLHVALA